MKKQIISLGIGSLMLAVGLVLPFSSVFAASYASCSISNGKKSCATQSVKAGASHKIYVELENKNNIDVVIEVQDTKNKKVIKKHMMYDKGRYFVYLDKVKSTYKVKLQCKDVNPFNNDKCNANVSVNNNVK